MAKKPKPKWGYEFRRVVKPFNFTHDQRRELQNHIHFFKLPVDVPSFVAALEKAIAEFIAYQYLEDEYPTRSEIVAALTELNNSATLLRQQLSDLDAATRQHLTIQMQSQPHFSDEPLQADQRTDMEALVNTLGDFLYAIGQVRQNSFIPLSSASGGRPPENEKNRFARVVADLFAAHTGLTPTATSTGPYETILRISLNAATGKISDNVHQHACRAVRRRNQREASKIDKVQ